MELKFSFAETKDTLKCSNCTFMELKSVMVNGKPDGERVLIVPLWN